MRSDHQPHTKEQAYSRGIWYAPFLLHGRTALMAIDSGGNRVAEAVVVSGADPETVGEWLLGVLERSEQTTVSAFPESPPMLRVVR